MIMEWLDVYNMERKLDPPLYMGLTLKSLLEKSDVLNTVNAALKATKDDEKKGEDPWETVDGQSAFLGPTLWDRDMFYDGDLKMEYMDLDEFLNEAAIPLVGGESNQQVTPPRVELSPLRPVASPPTINNDPILISADISEIARTPESPCDRNIDSPSCSIPEPIISAPVKKTTSRTAKKQQLKPVCSSPTPSTDMDLSMSSDGFGSRYSRYDDDDDLSPQPMSKKSKKQVRANQQYVPDDMKDDKYWARRRKNNLAAKRSRDARRMKENQIAVRAVILEKENAALKEEVERLRKENQQLKMARK